MSFEEELQKLGEALEAQGDLVVRSIRGAMEALVAQDSELADEVIAFDDEIDAAYLTIARGSEALLATQSPVAGDLRLVLSVLHSTGHLARRGDRCVTIAKLTKLSADLPTDEVLLDGFRDAGERAEQMTLVAVQSLLQRDQEAAESLMDLDELIDRANRRVVSRLLELGNANLEWALRMVVVSRCLERIGDHAVDIGEQAAFLVTGEFREFTDASH